MGENSLILENLPEHLYRAGKWLPTLSWSRFLDDPLRFAVAAFAGKIRQLEYCLQTLRPVERGGCLWKTVWPFEHRAATWNICWLIRRLFAPTPVQPERKKRWWTVFRQKSRRTFDQDSSGNGRARQRHSFYFNRRSAQWHHAGGSPAGKSVSRLCACWQRLWLGEVRSSVKEKKLRSCHSIESQPQDSARDWFGVIQRTTFNRMLYRQTETLPASVFQIW